MRTIAGKNGFTLIELLVVVAIISILLTLIIPAIDHAISTAKRLKCASNMRQLGCAWLMYAKDNNGKLVGANTRGEDDWVYSGRWNYARKIQGIKDGALWPYVEDVTVYNCPGAHGFLSEYARNYSISGNLNGEHSRWEQLSQVPSPSGTLLMIEDYDWREHLMNSWFIQRGGWYCWNDYVPGNHSHGDNILFADGHVEYRKWEDPDTLSVYSIRRFGMPDPDGKNPDMDYLGRVFKPSRFYDFKGRLENPDNPPWN